MNENQTCANCVHLTKKETCLVLKDFIYANTEMLDDSDYYLIDYDVEPNFCCNQYKGKSND